MIGLLSANSALCVISLSIKASVARSIAGLQAHPDSRVIRAAFKNRASLICAFIEGANRMELCELVEIFLLMLL